MLQKAMIRLVSPPLFINSPASTKNGRAIMVTLSVPRISWAATVWGLVAVPPIARAVDTPERMREKAMGSPSIIETTREARKIVVYKAIINASLFYF
jgi:hypothetical protein